LQFTLDERLVDGPVNAVGVPGAASLEPQLAAGDPSVRAITVGDALVFCTETLGPGEIAEIAAVWREVGAGAR
jgi:hypothetical protein